MKRKASRIGPTPRPAGRSYAGRSYAGRSRRAAVATDLAVVVAIVVGAALLGPRLFDLVGPGGLAGGTAAHADANVEVRVETTGYVSWTRLDRKTGRTAGSANMADTNTTESMVKPWIVADYLRVQAAHGRRPPDKMLQLASAAIRNSDDAAAETLYRLSGGDPVIERLIATCHLTDTAVHSHWWSRTRMSARDAVRMGTCIADGRAAGPKWTKWLLNEMRQVRGTTAAADQPGGGRWGIIDALPAKQAATVAIKNGWTPIWADGTWHLNCLAIADSWILAVEARYPVSLGLDHGARVCRTVAEQLLSR